MIVDERLVTYINSLDTGNTSILDQIEKEALDSYVPIIRKEMQQFLKLLLAMKCPMRILEVGTAVGFSSILMAEYDPVPCEITTIENPDRKRELYPCGKRKTDYTAGGRCCADSSDIDGNLRFYFYGCC